MEFMRIMIVGRIIDFDGRTRICAYTSLKSCARPSARRFAIYPIANRKFTVVALNNSFGFHIEWIRKSLRFELYARDCLHREHTNNEHFLVVPHRKQKCCILL
jgi:hypothetical protein